MTQKIFIAGCGRSGTTLAFRLMREGFASIAFVRRENPVSRFDEIETDERTIVLKRKARSRDDIHQLPPYIELIYVVRHPFDVLTSYHRKQVDRSRFYIAPARWMSEFEALQRLRAVQPKRHIFYWRYEDVIHTPETVQVAVGQRFELETVRPFRDVVELKADSIDKWRHNENFRHYLGGLPRKTKSQVRSFCDEFGYEMPDWFQSEPPRKRLFSWAAPRA